LAYNRSRRPCRSDSAPQSPLNSLTCDCCRGGTFGASAFSAKPASLDKFIKIEVEKSADMERTVYRKNLIFNNRPFSRVVISQHYKVKHGDLDDRRILELVQTVAGQVFDVDCVRLEDGIVYEFVVVEQVVWQKRFYRLIFVVPDTEDYLGVVNAFRVRRRR
jgi:hypothetical protein